MATTEESQKQLEYGKLRLSTSPFQLFLQGLEEGKVPVDSTKKDNAK